MEKMTSGKLLDRLEKALYNMALLFRSANKDDIKVIAKGAVVDIFSLCADYFDPAPEQVIFNYMDTDEYRLADFMHNNYEYFASQNGWTTQKKTRVNFEELPEENKQTMLDLAKHMIKTFDIRFDDICVKPPVVNFRMAKLKYGKST